MDAAGYTGFGSFLDLQVPINRDYNVRADGRKIGEENAKHRGMAIGGRLASGFRAKNWHVWPLRVSLLHLTAMDGPPETLSAGYNRVDLGSQIETALSLGLLRILASGEVGLRRTDFSNGSSSHYVSSIPLGLGLKLVSSRWSLRGYAHSAAQSAFGFSQSLLFGGASVAGSSSTLNDVGGQAEIRLSPAAWLTFGAEQENVRVQIPDVRAYEAFGLVVKDPRKTRDYVLTTSIFTLGIRKDF